jgi:hypothetical protein
VIAQLCGVRLDAMRAGRTHDLAQRARASQWIAANGCAISGIRAFEVPCGARLVHVDVPSLTCLLGVLAAMPALVDATRLPWPWRLALRALGIPVLDRTATDVVAAGIPVIVPVSSRVL